LIFNEFINILKNFKQMRKYILGGIALLAIAAVAAWNVNLNSQSNDLSDISLANVEALADDENGSESGWRQLPKTITNYTRDEKGDVISTETYTLQCCINNGPSTSCSADPGC
jgi:hypothetical protein